MLLSVKSFTSTLQQLKAGSTETKGGVVDGTENVYKYDAATKKVTLTYNDGNGNAVTDTKAVIDFSDLEHPNSCSSLQLRKQMQLVIRMVTPLKLK